MYINIHTHKLQPSENVLAVANLSLQASLPASNELFSLGIHPWDIPSLTPSQIEELLERIRIEPLFAIGEIGLDKLKSSDLTAQIELFKAQIAIANQREKPIIIHCVKAFNELLQLKSAFKNPAIIHGFRGKPSLMENLCKAGFFLSFGERFNEKTVEETPLDRLFLETDGSETPIQSIYQRVAEIKHCDLTSLKKAIEENFKRLSAKR